MEAIPIAKPTWVLELRGVSEPPAGVGAVDLMDETPGTGPLAVRIGGATVVSYSKTGETQGALTIRDLSMDAGRDPADVANQAISIGGKRYSVAAATGVPLFNVLYLQAGVAAVILILGAIVTYLYVGVKARSAEFLIATDGEMKKVHWSTRREVFGSTWVVIAACFLIAGLLWVFDFGFVALFQGIKLLHR
ncbi:MAG: preprotein translocase subunit SecE [Phycisphaerae bacterium]|nr:preprotein translocase subunit SecE [Phycisphaerae bacterium]